MVAVDDIVRSQSCREPRRDGRWEPRSVVPRTDQLRHCMGSRTGPGTGPRIGHGAGPGTGPGVGPGADPGADSGEGDTAGRILRLHGHWAD